MIIKIVFGIILILISALIGYLLSERIRVRKQIFEKFIDFNREFMCDLSLYRETVVSRIENADATIGKTLEGAAEKLRLGQYFSCRDQRLVFSEKKLVEDYVNSLGALDAFNQQEIMKMYDEKLKNVYLSLETVYQKSAKLYTRLGFAVGLIVFIVII